MKKTISYLFPNLKKIYCKHYKSEKFDLDYLKESCCLFSMFTLKILENSCNLITFSIKKKTK